MYVLGADTQARSRLHTTPNFGGGENFVWRLKRRRESGAKTIRQSSAKSQILRQQVRTPENHVSVNLRRGFSRVEGGGA